MLVVDEAHHLEWTPESVSPEYQLVEGLTQNSHGILLLTATPEQLGAEGHFARLRLLDPDRYPHSRNFVKSRRVILQGRGAVANNCSHEQHLTPDDQLPSRGFLRARHAAFDKALKDKSLLDQLVDRHGTGRVIFRNTRDALEGFPDEKQAHRDRAAGTLIPKLN